MQGALDTLAIFESIHLRKSESLWFFASSTIRRYLWKVDHSVDLHLPCSKFHQSHTYQGGLHSIWVSSWPRPQSNFQNLISIPIHTKNTFQLYVTFLYISTKVMLNNNFLKQQTSVRSFNHGIKPNWVSQLQTYHWAMVHIASPPTHRWNTWTSVILIKVRHKKWWSHGVKIWKETSTHNNIPAGLKLSSQNGAFSLHGLHDRFGHE